MKRHLQTFATALVLVGTAVAGHAQTKPADDPKAVIAEFQSRRQTLYDDLASGDPTRKNAAVAQIRKWCRAVPFGRDRGQMVHLLVEAKQYDDAEALALELIAFVPANTATVQRMQEERCLSQLAQGNPADALPLAKSFYNVCELRETPAATALLALCLAKANPDGSNIVERFKSEQADGVKPTSNPAGAFGAAKVTSVIAAIRLHDDGFDAEAAKVALNGFKSYIAAGNYLLLAGKGAEARAVFEEALKIATDEKSSAIANEGIARAIRAAEGILRPANEYMAAHPAK